MAGRLAPASKVAGHGGCTRPPKYFLSNWDCGLAIFSRTPRVYQNGVWQLFLLYRYGENRDLVPKWAKMGRFWNFLYMKSDFLYSMIILE
jgi:hypothetical protein